MTKIIYIVGSGRSGSTILDLGLGSNKNITGLGEVHRLSLDPDKRTCGCGRLINKCNFWSKVIYDYSDGAIKNWHELYPVTSISKRYKLLGYVFPRYIDLLAVHLRSKAAINFLLPGFTNKFSYINNSFNLFESVTKITGTEYIVDSSKNVLRAKLMYICKPDNVYIIHLVRDGRSIVESAKRRLNIDVKESTKMWRAVNKKSELALNNVPAKRKLTIRYEDYCRFPNIILSEINNFINNNDPLFDLDTLISEEHHQIPGNPLLKKAIKGISLQESWKKNLSEQDLSIFGKLAGDLNKKYGYE